jgi:tRNA1Val (adenine37-N6)-methyltransferase
MERVFQFRQFQISHEASKMKVGTDGVLLGVFVDTRDAGSILDVGTGCGLIALMLAQRCKARITGIDIDGDSVSEAMFNGRNCPWSDRLTFIHSPLQDFAARHTEEFDLIVSNPPFFMQSLRSPDESRNLARHDLSLSHEDLFRGTARLLRPNGRCLLILPYSHFAATVTIAAKNKLYPKTRMVIHPKVSAPPNRMIVEFVMDLKVPCETRSFIIRDQDGAYTEEYREKTGDFYVTS